MSEAPLVTIGVPVRDGELHLAEALDSALAQRYPNLEILISDNDSSDSTPDICRRYAATDPRVRWRRNSQDLGFALNFAVTAEQARGRYFTWLAHDDRLEPDYLGTVVAFMERHPDVVLGTTDVNLLNLEGPGRTTLVKLEALRESADWRQARRALFRFPSRSLFYVMYGSPRRAG